MIKSIYVASSWRNSRQPDVVETLRRAHFEVYDFRHPEPGSEGFSWKQVVGYVPPWPAHVYVSAMRSDTATQAYRLDLAALKKADACVLVAPCGRSAHWELGYAHGMGKPTAVLLERCITEPELMIHESFLTDDLADLIIWLKRLACPT